MQLVDTEQFRDVFLKMFIGYNRTGKTTIAKQYANKWRVANPHGTIAGYDPQGKFKHLIKPSHRIKFGQTKGWWKKLRKYYEETRCGLFIADEYRDINPAGQPSEDFNQLMAFRAEWGIDIILICHSPIRVLRQLVTYISEYYIFYTKGQNSTFEANIDNYEECQCANDLIKDYIKDGRHHIIKKHWENYNPDGQFNHTFPFIIVDTIEGRLIPVNLEKDWVIENRSRFQETV